MAALRLHATPALLTGPDAHHHGERHFDPWSLWPILEHWGVAVRVLHYVKDEGSAKGRLAVTSVADFQTSSPAIEVLLHKDRSLDPVETVHRAEAHEGYGEYWLLDHNCEHFSTWCATGRWASAQVGDVAHVLTLGSILVKWLVVPAVVLSNSAEREPPVGECRVCTPTHSWKTAQATAATTNLSHIERRLAQAQEDRGRALRLEDRWTRRSRSGPGRPMR